MRKDNDSEEPKEQHDAGTRGSLRHIAIALAHLWLVSCYLKHLVIPWGRSEYFVYADRDLDWGRELMAPHGPFVGKKRIKVTIEIETY